MDMTMQGEAEKNHQEPLSSLTDKERVMIQDTWAIVYENCDDVGVTILVRLFMNYPSSKQFFSKFRHIKEKEELERSVQLRRHARRVMDSYKSLVENLEDSEKLTSVLEAVAKSHMRHNVEPVYFKILGDVLLEVLGEMPEVVTPEVGAAWTKLMAFVYCGVTAVYEEVGWTNVSSSTG